MIVYVATVTLELKSLHYERPLKKIFIKETQHSRYDRRNKFRRVLVMEVIVMEAQELISNR